MIVEMHTLENNGTWKLVYLPPRKWQLDVCGSTALTLGLIKFITSKIA